MGHPSDHSRYAAAPQPTLISVVRERLRVKHYSLRTEQSYGNLSESVVEPSFGVTVA